MVVLVDHIYQGMYYGIEKNLNYHQHGKLEMVMEVMASVMTVVVPLLMLLTTYLQYILNLMDHSVIQLYGLMVN